MTDYFATQVTGSPCQWRNCAAASGAMAVAFNTAGAKRPTADAFRTASGRSCVPGDESPSGGLFISDVERAAATYGVTIDYGRERPGAQPRRWPETEMTVRLSTGWGAVVLGDYDQVPRPYRAPTSSFQGDHSAFAHDLEDGSTVCWHDPLRSAPIRIPYSVLIDYWQKPDSPVRGLAGFVRITEVDVAPAPITTLTPLLVSAPDGADLFDLDARTKLTDSENALVDRHSPYGVGEFRAIYITTNGLRRLALLRPASTKAIPPVDCAAAIAADRAKARIVYP